MPRLDRSIQSDSITAVFSKAEEVAANALELPPWERFVSVANGLLKVTDQALNDAARELHVPDKVEEFRSTFRDIISTSAELRENMSELTQKGMSLDDISNELSIAFEVILEYMKETFPPPDHAPGHEDRERMVQTIFEKVEEAILNFAQKHGMSEDGQKKVRETLDRLKPHLEKLVIIAGA